MKQVNSILLMAVVLAGGGSCAAIAASTDGIQASDEFRYEMSRSAAVDIKLVLPGGNPASLSFYSEGANGLRLLETTFTDPTGHYVGQLQLPAHLSRVMVVVHGVGRQNTLTLPINANSITYAE